jgi:adenosylcobinamide-GDP ribazoletransferase
MQFLTRVPVPSVEDFSTADLARSAAWFPFVGLLIGGAVGSVLFAIGHVNVLIAAVVGVVAWVGLTGAIHLDGLADLSDALGAAHRDRERFFAVLRDPHLGTFGVVSVVLTVMLKVAALVTVAGNSLGALPPLSGMPLVSLVSLPLILAWARLGTLAWGRWLKPLQAGQGERFAAQLSLGWIVVWTVVLLVASAICAPVLCAAPLVIAAWGLWLKARLGGMTGDCLGAGVEVTETALLLLVALI